MKTTSIRVVVVLLLALLAGTPLARYFFSTAQSAATPIATKPLAEFDIDQGPRPICIPVSLNGKTVLFCVDTGAWKTVFDISLKSELGQPIGNTTALTSSGSLQGELFACPQASIGRIPLSGLESVFCHDMTSLRCASGKDIYGVLGMDFLHKYAVEFNYDGGKLRLWEQAPTDWQLRDQATRLSFDESNRPCVGALVGVMEETFLLDTGSNNSTLKERSFDELRDRGEIQLGTNYSAMAAAGGIRGKTGYIRTLTVQSFSHENLRLDRDRFSSLGLNYLARYTVRLDFLNSVAYFVKGNRFSIPDPTATCGLSIVQIDGNKIVYLVEPGGPAAAKHIQPGDVILAVDGRDATQYDMVSLREILTQKAGVSVPLQLRRNNDVYTAAVELQSRLLR